MSVELNEVINDTAEVKVPLPGGQKLEVVYKPNVITTKMIAKAMVGNQTDEFNKMCCELLVDWDLLKDNKKVPITPTGLEGVPVLILKAIFGEIIDNTSGSGEA